MIAILKQISIVKPADNAMRWRSIATHSHFLRSGGSPLDEVKSRALAWCQANNVAAVGVGSPWEPVSSESYARCETSDRDIYYGGRIDHESVMHRGTVQALLDDLNARCGGKTLFYLDNENPKRSNGHLWHFGYNYDFPAWHDYGQDRPVKSWEGEREYEINQITGEPHCRRPYPDVVASQRKAGAIMVWAHPTSWWFAPESCFSKNPFPVVHQKPRPGSWWESNGRFVSNIAVEAVGHLYADGYLDGMVVQGYDACQSSYQALWFSLLDLGAVVPGFAENDTSFDTPHLLDDSRGSFMTMMPLETLSAADISRVAKTGECFATSGPFATVSADGVSMGSSVATSADTLHQVVVEAHPAPGQQTLSRLELIGRGGESLFRLDNFEGGVLHLEVPGSDKPSYLIVRVFGQGDNPDAVRKQSIKHMAITNPVYLKPGGFSFKPSSTRLKVHVPPAGVWAGCQAELRTNDGVSLGFSRLKGGGNDFGVVPASARLVVTRRNGLAKELGVLNENPSVQRLYSHLSRGEFLTGLPGIEPGDVPVEAFMIKEMAEAVSSCEINL